MRLKLTIAIVVAAAAGWFAARWSQSRAEGGAEKRVLFYQSPMHPWVKSGKPGQCTVCGMDLVPVYEGGKSFDAEAPDIVMLPEGSPGVIGVRTAAVKKRPLARTLRVAGTIGEDMSRHGVISAPVEGRIDGLSVNHPGQQVTRRQPLATLFSRTLLGAADEYKRALPQGGATLETAKRKLEHYGLVWEQIKSIPERQPDDIHFGVLSPLTGVIVKSHVAEGQYVRAGQPLVEVADFTTLWFMFPVYEPDLPHVKPRQIVKVTTPSLPGRTITARISAVSPVLDETTRTAMARVVIENPERSVLDNVSAEAVIEADAPEVLAVPRPAVLWPAGAPLVFVEKQEGVYQRREVKLGRTGDTDWEVLEGLREGEVVVTGGNMLIEGQAQLNNLGSPAEP